MGGRSVITIVSTLSGVAAILNRAARHYTLAAGWNKENRSTTPGRNGSVLKLWEHIYQKNESGE
jgi:hypothetical protein